MRLFLFFQKIFGTRVSASGTPSGLLEPSGTREAPLEQSLRLYLERALAQMELLKPPKRALAQLELLEPPGTRVSALGTPSGLLEQSLRLPGTRASAHGTPSGFWNHQEQTLRLSCPPIGAKEQFR